MPSVLVDKVEILDFVYEASEYPKIVGKKFQVIFVGTAPNYSPFTSMADSEGIQKNKIYVRRGTSTEEANYQEVQNIINKRIETGYSSRNEIDLRTHIEELEMLYGLVKSSYIFPTSLISSQLQSLSSAALNIAEQYKSIPNRHYPTESYEAFIARAYLQSLNIA